MYLKRKTDDFLVQWKSDPDRKPLIIRGPRQVGKTETIRKFAAENYENVIEINFVEQPKYKIITGESYEPEEIIKSISLLDNNKRFVPGKTLLFFDEIQDFPEIATSLKFFCMDGRFDVICSGSMLGINYNRIESNSVGYKTDYTMYSLDFEEFLWAKGYDNAAGEILAHMTSQKPFSEVEMKVYSALFMDYCILGGMPAVVKQYIEKGTFEGVLDIQQQLLKDYQEDIKKYADGVDKTRILNIFRHIPVQLAKENKKFQISKVATGARFKDYRGCIDWLDEAGLINICYCMMSPELPLGGNYDDSRYKLYFKDTGLLIAMLDEESQEDLRVNKNMNVYKGGLFESIVGEALVKSGCKLYYYKRENSTLEEDFFLRTRDSLVPVEVKASNNKSKSLSTLIGSEKYPDIRFGIKLINGNIGFVNNIYSFPHFCAFLLKPFLRDMDK